jgi:DNA-binding NarL/FixJ family response regulator
VGAEDIGASLQQSILDGGATSGRRARPSRFPGDLTRREYQVVQQIASGMTNREIAAELSLSEKTIEMHVSHSLAKLDARSRAQLAVWFAGLDSPVDTSTDPMGV